MNRDQDWCLQCGTGAPGSLMGAGHGLISPAVVLVATLALVLGAAAASYAAWGKSSSAPAATTTTIAQAPQPTTPAPAVVVATSSTTTASTTTTPKLGKTRVKPPKIPVTKTSTTTSSTTTSEAESTTTATTQTTSGEALPEPILLDTNAATTYNPNNYPAGEFGDPTLAIDGDTGTGWTAQVNPSLAPKLEAGLLVDLKAAQKISGVELISSTPGMTVQLFGSNPTGPEPTAPATITDSAWVPLSKTVVAKNRHEHIKLLHPTSAYRYIVLWIREVPAAAIGTAQAPGRITVNELELFPSSE